MPANYDNVRLGDRALVFGIEDVEWGYLRNICFEEAPQKSMARNGVNNVVAVEYSGRGERKCSGTFYFKKGHSGPMENVGTDSPVQFRGVADNVEEVRDYYVESVTEQRTAGDWCSIDFEAMSYPFLVNS